MVFISKRKLQSEKVPAQVLAKSSTIGFASHHRTWGTLSRKNLMKMYLKCQSTRSTSWVVKKASSWAEVRCDGLRVTTVTLKSSFLPEGLL